MCNFFRTCDRVFREPAGLDDAEDMVTLAEPGNALSELLDHTGNLSAQMDRQGHPHPLASPATDLPIHRVYACRMDLHQDFASLRIRTHNVGVPKNVVVTILVDDHCFHDFSLSLGLSALDR